MAGDDVLVHVAPAGNGSLALITDNSEGALVGLLSLKIGNNIEDDDGAEVTHTLLSDAEQLAAVLAELDALDGRGEVPGLEAFTGTHVPETNGVVGAATRDHGGSRVDVDGPDSALMTLVGTETLAVVGEPDADLLVLGGGE